MIKDHLQEVGECVEGALTADGGDECIHEHRGVGGELLPGDGLDIDVVLWSHHVAMLVMMLVAMLMYMSMLMAMLVLVLTAFLLTLLLV